MSLNLTFNAVFLNQKQETSVDFDMFCVFGGNHNWEGLYIDSQGRPKSTAHEED